MTVKPTPAMNAVCADALALVRTRFSGDGPTSSEVVWSLEPHERALALSFLIGWITKNYRASGVPHDILDGLLAREIAELRDEA